MVTSSASLDDDDLWFVHQCRTFLWTKIFVNFVNREFIWLILSVIDSKDKSSFPVRHDHHKHAVCVFEFRVCGKLTQSLFNILSENGTKISQFFMKNQDTMRQLK